MSLAPPPNGVRAVKSFQNSAALPAMPIRPARDQSATKRKSPTGKLPTLDGQTTSLPSINPRHIEHKESVPLEHLPTTSKKKKKLEALGGSEKTKENRGSANQDGAEGAGSSSSHKTRRRDRKADEKQMIKDQVTVAVQAVREVFETAKGKNILELETKVFQAKANDEYVTSKVKRKSDTDSLGISFTIPARVMALGWESGQHLVVTDTTQKPGVKSSLAIQDIVVEVDNIEVHSIEDLKRCVAGKKKMHFKCIRMSGPIAEEELAETQARIEKALKAAVKAKVKSSLKARRKRNEGSDL